MTTLSRRRFVRSVWTAVVGAFASNRIGDGETYGAWLVGSNEVPPVETDAFGVALFRVGPDVREIATGWSSPTWRTSGSPTFTGGRRT